MSFARAAMDAATNTTRHIIQTAAMAAMVCLGMPAGAQTTTWIGGTSTDWSDPSNWNPGGVPSGVDTLVNTSSGNLATVLTDVSSLQPIRLRLGDGAAGTMNVQSGGNLTVNGETWIGNTSSGSGTNNISGGKITAYNWFAAGRGGGQGTVNMTGGNLNVFNNPIAVGIDSGSDGVFNQSAGTVASDSDLWIANSEGATGTYNLSGTASLTVNSWTVVGRAGGHGTLNISGGSLTKISGNDNQLIIGVDDSQSLGTINQTGGAITNVLSDTHLGSYTAGTGIWNLNGGLAVLGLLQVCHSSGAIGTFNLNTNGTLIAAEITTGSAGSASAFNFNGGTLAASGNNANFLHGLTTLNVRNGGVIIDDGGYAIGIPQNLTHSAIDGDNAIDGGLTKNGVGTLALSGVNTYTGGTIINQGTLELDATGSNPGALRLASGTTLNLNYSGTYAVAGFHTNGVALSDGTYNSGNLPEFITGTGDLQVGIVSLGIWDGGGVNNNWSTGANWDQDVVPVFPIGLTFAGSTRLVNNNDLPNITVSSITFDAAAGAFTLSGNDITLNGVISFTANPAAPITQTVNFNMAWSADKTFDPPANGSLTLGGAITSGNGLTKAGNGTLTLGGADSFASFNVNGGTNTITGSTTVKGTGSGVFYLGNGRAIAGCNGTLVIQPGATLSVTGSFDDDCVIGRDGGSGTVIQNGGTFIFNNDRPNMWVGAASLAGTRSEYDMNGGLLDLSGNTLGVGVGNGVLSTGIVNQAGGVITNAGSLWLGGLETAGYGAYTLSGGSIYLGTNNATHISGIATVSGLYSINLGGGTVGAEANWFSPLNMNLTGLNGAVTFDTADNAITLSGALSGTGGLTKAGSGLLELSSGHI